MSRAEGPFVSVDNLLCLISYLNGLLHSCRGLFSTSNCAQVQFVLLTKILLVKSNKQGEDCIWAIPWGLIQGRCGPVSDFIFDALSGKSVCILVGFEVFSSHIPTVADI